MKFVLAASLVAAASAFGVTVSWGVQSSQSVCIQGGLHIADFENQIHFFPRP
jgi:hypothetical protein